ncbi:hypothetical protein SRSM4_040 [Synechococcus phage S-RSM4]|uniref:Uncharacterized protein n=1 Tax=Synechococcus phage S-RSM4 TaxID=555387 RepID=C7BV08_9CAUD|nr:hypothetical protein SRSM4_040 [Synechococcus phage S-RSM4]CAR63237.1 hypothetical protein SRSM4_040 [Synechococcus phage S-RSM4]
MAINFPATAGQPTDGTFTYVAAGITYSWNGESWTAAGSGATATDLTVFSVSNAAASGGGSLAYNTNTGDFTFTPPDLSSYLTSIGVLNNHTDVNISGIADGQLLKYDSFSGDWINWTPNYLTSYTETDPVFSASAASGITLTKISYWDAAYGWGDHSTQGYLTALPSRGTVSQTVSSLASGASADVSFTTPKTYALLKIETSHAAWVTLYTDTNSRTSDSGRNEFTDPTPGSGVIAEVITTGGATQLITPGTIGFNSAASTTTYAKIVNKSAFTANVQVTLTYVKLED